MDSPTLTCPLVPTDAMGFSKKSRGDNYSYEEDTILVNGWLCISLDGVVGTGQKFSKLWDRIHGYYHECKKPSHPERTKHSLSNRWSTIRGSVNKFCGCLAQIEHMNPSGCAEADKIKMARITYRDTWESDFPFDYCWEILRTEPKWILQKEQVKTKKRKGACDSQTAPAAIDIGDEVATNPDECERPPGRKALKANEMKRKYKEEKSALFEKVVTSLKEERKQQHDEKMEKIDKLAQIEEKKVMLMEKRLNQEEKDKLMLMDMSGLDSVTHEYFQKRRLEILHGEL